MGNVSFCYTNLNCTTSLLLYAGAIYINDCPQERLIPIYLIVAGCTAFFTSGLGQLKPKQGEDGETEQKPVKERFNIVSMIGAIGALFTFAWLICGKHLSHLSI